MAHSMKIRFVSLVCLCLTALMGCRNSDVPAVESHAVQIIGYTNQQKLYHIKATPDGGYVVLSKKYQNGFENVMVHKYGAENQFQWLQSIGSTTSAEYDPNIAVASDQSVLVGCITEGIGMDSLPSTQSKSFGVMLAKLDPSGSVLWERAFFFSTQNQGGTLLSIPYITEDSEHNILMCANTTYGERFQYGLFGMLLKISPEGRLQKTYLAKEGHHLQYVYDTLGRYVCFHQRNEKCGFYEFDKQDTGMFIKPITSSTILNPQAVTPMRPLLFHDDDLSAQYLSVDQSVVRIAYDIDFRMLNSKILDTQLDSIEFANVSLDNNYLMVSGNRLFETDHNFSIQNSFQNALWDINDGSVSDQMLCKLTDGDYVYGYQHNQVVYLYRMNHQGKMKLDE